MTHSTFSIEYELRGSGWADCTVEAGDLTFAESASYLSDPVGQLAAAAIMLRLGAESARIVWAHEPGETRWGVDVANPASEFGSILRFRTWSFENFLSRLPDENGELKQDFLVTLPAFVSGVTDMLEQILRRYGMRGYVKKWHEYPFPIGMLKDLRRLATWDPD